MTYFSRFICVLAATVVVAAAPLPDDEPAAVDIAVEDSGDAAQLPLALPLRWTTEFGDHLEAGSTLELSWTGGDSAWGYEVYVVPQWPRMHDYGIVPLANVSESSWTWNVPPKTAWPAHTTFIVGVKDATERPGADWYDLSRALPLQ